MKNKAAQPVRAADALSDPISAVREIFRMRDHVWTSAEWAAFLAAFMRDEQLCERLEAAHLQGWDAAVDDPQAFQPYQPD